MSAVPVKADGDNEWTVVEDEKLSCSHTLLVRGASLKPSSSETAVYSNYFKAADGCDEVYWCLKLHVKSTATKKVGVSVYPYPAEFLGSAAGVPAAVQQRYASRYKIVSAEGNITQVAPDQVPKQDKLLYNPGSSVALQVAFTCFSLGEFDRLDNVFKITVCVTVTYLEEKKIKKYMPLHDGASSTSLVRPVFKTLFDETYRAESEDNSADVVFLLEDGKKKLRAHKVVLMGASPVFKRMFESNMLEKKNNRMEITDIRKNVMLQVLKFIYLGEADTSDLTMTMDLLSVAERYSLKDLKDYCENALIYHDMCNPLDLLLFADTHNAENLKAFALERLRREPWSKSMCNNVHWQNLVKTHPDIFEKILSMKFGSL